MAVLKARASTSDSFVPVSTMGQANATQSQRGLMSASDKTKLDGLSNEAEDISYDNTTSGMTADNVQEAIDGAYSAANSKVPFVSSAPYMCSIGNVGNTSKTRRLTFSVAEQLFFIIGSGSTESYYLTQICGNNTSYHDYGMTGISVTYGSNYVDVTFPNWFRGIVMSYQAFSFAVV